MKTQIGEIGEWALIERIRRILRRHAPTPASARIDERQGVVLDVGDDGAVVRPGVDRDLVLETDAAIEGVHFRFGWASPEQIGRRIAVQGLSDLAAMGAWPRWLLLSLGLPAEVTLECVEGMVAGVAAYAARFGARVVGGNVAQSPSGVHAHVCVVGEVERGCAVTRGGARVGDGVYVSGWPGRARAGWLWLARRGGATAGAGAVAGGGVDAVVGAFREPHARLEEARWLCAHAQVHAMIDLSDGLGGDAAHLACASGVAIVLEAAALGRDPKLEAAARVLGMGACELALAGGDDFELLFTAVPACSSSAWTGAFEGRFGLPLRRIGRVEAGESVLVQKVMSGLLDLGAHLEACSLLRRAQP